MGQGHAHRGGLTPTASWLWTAFGWQASHAGQARKDGMAELVRQRVHDVCGDGGQASAGP